MTTKVELIPVSEGNRITVEKDEKVIVGRGSSLGCNEKKISRHHAELFLKDNHTLWIKPTHTNPVFYRSLNGKIIQLPKDAERELKEGDQIGLLPSSFFFRVSITTEVNNNHESDSESDSERKKVADPSPVRASSPDAWSPKNGSRHSTSNQEASIFEFDDEVKLKKTTTPAKRTPVEKKIVSDVAEPKPASPAPSPATPARRSRIPAHRLSPLRDREESESETTGEKTRKLPKWMLAPTPSPVAKPTTTTPKSSQSRKPSSTPASATSKRHLSFDDDSNDASNTSDVRSPAPTTESKPPARVLSKIPSTRSFDEDNGDADGDAAGATTKTPPAPKKMKSVGKRRPACQFGATCYRKNPLHRTEQSHPGDSDHEDNNGNNDTASDDTDVADKPDCPFGKACYRQNPQHKRDFKH